MWRITAQVLPGPPQHHLAQPGAVGADAGCLRAAELAAGGTADREHPVEPPGESAGEAEAWELEADEVEVLGEVQAQRWQFSPK